jgi:hypothetical protein
VTDPANPGQPYGGYNPYNQQGGTPYGAQGGNPYSPQQESGNPYGGAGQNPYGNPSQGGQPYSGSTYGSPQGGSPQSGPPYGGPPQSGPPYGSPPYTGSAYPAQGGTSYPPPGGGGPAPAPFGTPTPPPRRRGIGGGLLRALISIVVLIVVAGGFAAYRAFSHRNDTTNAKVNDCIHSETLDSDTAKQVKDTRIVKCDDPSANYKVVGIVPSKTETDFDTDKKICAAYPTAESAIWQGVSGEPGSVLCLAPNKK